MGLIATQAIDVLSLENYIRVSITRAIGTIRDKLTHIRVVLGYRLGFHQNINELLDLGLFYWLFKLQILHHALGSTKAV